MSDDIAKELDATKNRCRELAEEAVALQMQLTDKSQGEAQQLRAWALDRAIETAKIGAQSVHTADVLGAADMYVAWVMQPSKQSLNG